MCSCRLRRYRAALHTPAGKSVKGPDAAMLSDRAGDSATARARAGGGDKERERGAQRPSASCSSFSQAGMRRRDPPPSSGICRPTSTLHSADCSWLQIGRLSRLPPPPPPPPPRQLLAAPPWLHHLDSAATMPCIRSNLPPRLGRGGEGVCLISARAGREG